MKYLPCIMLAILTGSVVIVGPRMLPDYTPGFLLLGFFSVIATLQSGYAAMPCTCARPRGEPDTITLVSDIAMDGSCIVASTVNVTAVNGLIVEIEDGDDITLEGYTCPSD